MTLASVASARFGALRGGLELHVHWRNRTANHLLQTFGKKQSARLHRFLCVFSDDHFVGFVRRIALQQWLVASQYVGCSIYGGRFRCGHLVIAPHWLECWKDRAHAQSRVEPLITA